MCEWKPTKLKLIGNASHTYQRNVFLPGLGNGNKEKIMFNLCPELFSRNCQVTFNLISHLFKNIFFYDDRGRGQSVKKMNSDDTHQ